MKRREAYLAGGGLLIEGGFVWLARLGDLRLHLPLFIVIYITQFLAMVGAFSLRHSPQVLAPSHYTDGGRPPKSQWRTGNPSNQTLILSFAVLFRLTLLPTMPSLSDDIYRYGWEGRVQRAGLSPYEYPPGAPELVRLRDAAYPLINHKEVPTIYPPLTQFVFRLGSYVRDLCERLGMGVVRAAVLSQKLFFLFFDLLSMGVLLALLRLRRLNAASVVLYAWNPLVVLEFAGSGHNDSLGILYLLAGIYFWEKGRTLWGTAGLAVSYLSKYLSILLVPFLVWKRRWKELALWSLFVAAGMAPFCFCWLMAQGASHYAARWQFNGSLFVLMVWALHNMTWAKWGAAGLLALFACMEGRRQNDVVRLTAFVIMAALLLAPDVHPWYFTWLVPFLCIFPRMSWLVWNATIALSYTVWHRYSMYHVWDLHPAIQAAEYLPFYGLLFYETLRRRLAR